MDGFDNFLSDFGDIDENSHLKPKKCEKCKRPKTVCWCPYLPLEPINCKTTVHILQHPFEERRRLKTAPMLQQSLVPGKCIVYPGKRISLDKHPSLKKIVEDDSDTLLLFPGEEATDLNEYLRCLPESHDRHYNIILLDGTWLLAKGLYFKNTYLQKLKQVKIEHDKLSEYVIRTQPTDNSLCTLETAALAIAQLENTPQVYDVLMRPLRALCDFQMQRGAVAHQSKEYLIQHGLYKKQISKSTDGYNKQTQISDEELNDSNQTIV